MNEALQTYLKEIQFSGDLKKDIKSFFAAHKDGKTLAHTLSVASEAKRVATLYGADPVKAEQAALLHDISNVVPVAEMLDLAKKLSIEIMDEEYTYGRIVHQKLSKAMAREIFNITDPEILDAIECHTTLKAQASLMDKVLFISDKISWQLPGDHQYLFEARHKVDEMKLNEGVLIYLNQVWENRLKLKLIHPWLIQARAELMSTFPELETERFILRQITHDDAKDIFQTFSLDEVTKYYDVESFTNIEQAEQLIQTWHQRFENKQAIRWGIALKSDNRVVGTCGFHGWVKNHHKAAIGYELTPQFWRQGVMTEVLGKIMEYGFDTLELNRIEAFVEPENVGSRRVLEKVGFQAEGLLKDNYYWKNRFVDNVIYALIKKDFKKMTR
ncbi:bis(5'-nucleosyl)-tetraphosphatase (symmetrical) YqeK [Paenibacillus tundrae]